MIMMKDLYTLNDLKVGQWLIVESVGDDCPLRERLKDIGLTPGARVACEMKSPLGDPVAYRIRGAVVALRREDARSVFGRYIGADFKEGGMTYEGIDQ